MANLNRVIMLGNLTRDPELRYTPSGSPVAKFRLATNQRIRQQEEWKDDVCYIDVVTFGKQAENVAEYLSVGNMALVEGRLQWREWEGRDGIRRSKYDIVASTVQFLSRPNGESRVTDQSGLPFAASAERDELDDVPF